MNTPITSVKHPCNLEQVAAHKSVKHPLDLLTEAELTLASHILKTQKNLGKFHRFPLLQLNEPSKEALQAFEQHNTPCPREAFALILDKSTGEAFEAIVNLETETIVEWTKLDTDIQGQPPLMIEEFDDLVKIVQEDPDWIAAVKKCGLTDEDIQNIQIDP